MTIDMETLRQWLDDGRPVTVLDVRPASERQEWSIPGSLHVDAYDALRAGVPSSMDTVRIPEDAAVVTVCAAGRTSLLAAEALLSRGIAARSLEGGMKAWSLAWNAAEVPVDASGTRVIQVRRTGKGCLSYIAACGGEAAVVDASVAPRVYLDLAESNGWRIVTVIDTHVHADHLSRSRALAAAAGALLVLPAHPRVSYPHEVMRDGDEIRFGSRGSFTAIHTPGHTAESVCLFLAGGVLLTGDTLFLGGVGRPDLQAGPAEAEQRCRQLFASLRRILSLRGDTVVLPSHTSAPVPFDGVPLRSTLDGLRAALQGTEEGFVSAVLSRIPPVPPPLHITVLMPLPAFPTLTLRNSGPKSYHHRSFQTS
jgi:glyoxylase-like metal-dependent hydrolase (beta-lactamase superfamily II)